MESEEPGGSLHPDAGDRLSLLDVAVRGYSPLEPANDIKTTQNLCQSWGVYLNL